MLAFVTITTQAQTANGSETPVEGLLITNPQTVTATDFITTTGADGTQGRVLGENISLSVIPPVSHFTPLTPNIKGYFQGVDDALNNLNTAKENVANKATDFSVINDVKYPSTQAVKEFVSPYNGDTWGVLGDSFAELDLFQPALFDKLGVTTIDSAIGGSCITGGTGNAEGDGFYRTPYVDRIVSMLTNSITGIVIEGGSNDFHYNIPLGEYGSTNVNEFYGALNFICNKIANHPTKIKAVFITPTFRGDSQHGGSSTGLANWENMKPYITAIKTVCSKYSIQVVDEFGSGINFYNTDVYTIDGVHPTNAAGTELYNNFLIANINAGTLNVVPLDVAASYDQIPKFTRTIYWNKYGASLMDDAAIVVTNGIDNDLRMQITGAGASNKHISISTSRIGVNLSLMELYGKLLIGTVVSSSDDILQVNGGTLSKSITLYNGGITFRNLSNTANLWNFNKGAGDGSDNLNVYNFSRSAIDFSINNTTGVAKINNLAGTGSRLVQADASGNLSATQVQPKKYTALISQTGTSAPTATVLENTLGGTVVWTRTGAGAYVATLSNAFTINKTFLLLAPSASGGQTNTLISNSSSTVELGVFSNAGNFSDGFLTNRSIEIRVYL